MQITIEQFEELLDAEIVTADFYQEFNRMYQDTRATHIEWLEFLVGYMLREMPGYERGTLMEE